MVGTVNISGGFVHVQWNKLFQTIQFSVVTILLHSTFKQEHKTQHNIYQCINDVVYPFSYQYYHYSKKGFPLTPKVNLRAFRNNSACYINSINRHILMATNKQEGHQSCQGQHIQSSIVKCAEWPLPKLSHIQPFSRISRQLPNNYPIY